MKLSVKGEYKGQSNIQTISDTLQKRQIQIEIADGNYQYPVVFDLVKSSSRDQLALAENFKPGDQVEVFFNISCRENKGRWFTNLNAWKITASRFYQDSSFPGSGDERNYPENSEPTTFS